MTDVRKIDVDYIARVEEPEQETKTEEYFVVEIDPGESIAERVGVFSTALSPCPY